MPQAAYPYGNLEEAVFSQATQESSRFVDLNGDWISIILIRLIESPYWVGDSLRTYDWTTTVPSYWQRSGIHSVFNTLIWNILFHLIRLIPYANPAGLQTKFS